MMLEIDSLSVSRQVKSLRWLGTRELGKVCSRMQFWD